MDNKWVVIVFSFGYLALLFAIAYWAEKRGAKGKSFVKNPYVYSLSLAVYCTAWTYYGSVGRAAENGLDFLTVYIGPTLMAPLWWVILRKVIRICKTQRITTIADFISSRYGKSVFLGSLATIVCVLGVLPYISIQLKAISSSLSILTQGTTSQVNQSTFFYQDTAFYIAIMLGIFTVLFGTRKIDSTERHEGMVTAIAFESIFKLFAFLAVGLYVTYGIFGGFSDVFGKAAQVEALRDLFVFDSENGFTNWFWLNCLSMMAIVFLPRQFHVAVKENVNENHLKKSIWLFPLYLLLINIFVLPIAFGGKMVFAEQNVDADTYVLAIPLFFGKEGLALFAYLGGFSAATSMIIVSTTALSIMLSNNVIMPLVVGSNTMSRTFKSHLSSILVYSRQAMILLILLMAYLYFKLVGEQFSLVSIGLISFVAVAQFAPTIIGGIFWKGGTRIGAIAGIIGGFTIWFITLVVPTMIVAEILPQRIMEEGLFSVSLLRPDQLFGFDGLDYIPHALFWSLFINMFLYVSLSLMREPLPKERSQAQIFVDIFKYSVVSESAVVWKGSVRLSEIKSLVAHFLGDERTEQAFEEFYKQHSIDYDQVQELDARLIFFAENLLAGAIGTSSARVMIASIAKEDEISLEEMLKILDESQQYISLNKALLQKSKALEEAGKQLQIANTRLQQMDKLKDEFISTVTHEMRTPITSIRAFCEILYDNPDLNLEEKEHFLNTIIKETERMDRLITQVLELEKFESGKQKIELRLLDMNMLINDSVSSMDQMIKERQIALKLTLDPALPQVFADQDRMVQVMLNLISNAVKFCDPEQGQITILSQQKADRIKVSVKDNGKGIPAEGGLLIFESFYQAKNQNTKKPKGSGLGLTISKKIVEHHGGKIWAQNNAEGGAEFLFEIPLVNRLEEKTADA